MLSNSCFSQDLKGEFELFLKWFEGRFDNYAQVVEEKEQKVEHPHEWIHSIFKRVNLPQIGEYVFFVQQYMDGDPEKIYRQRLYVFELDTKEKAIKLTIYNFDDEKRYKNAHLETSKLEGLSFANLRSIPGCEVYWRYDKEKERFEGSMKPNSCKFFSQRLGKTIIVTDDLLLTKDEIWINDQARDEQGNHVFGNKSNIHHKLRKARIFRGWTAILKDLSVETRGEDLPADQWIAQRNLQIHDQGGIAKINEKFSVQLAQLTHKSGIKVLKLGIIENSTGKTIAYTWTNPEAERIGINLRWIQAGFTLEK